MTKIVTMPVELPVSDPDPGWGQCLYTGGAGIALLRVEHARCGTGDWETAHQWVMAMTRSPITVDPDAVGLHHGAPAVAFVLYTSGHPAYAGALEQLDHHIDVITRYRLDRAHERIEMAHLPALAEYDLIAGLTGLGTYLLCRHHGGDLLREVLTYLVRLTFPLTVNGTVLPGWWSTHGPQDKPAPHWPGGHANLGLAHGISGPLALLSTALRCGIDVAGQIDAISRICRWLDQWKAGTGAAAWWPGMISAAEHRTGSLDQSGPQRPSWCYGTPGLVRAQQLAGLALDDHSRQRAAELALAGCLADPAQLRQIRSASLCHGWAGLLQTAARVAADSPTPELFPVDQISAMMHDHLDHNQALSSPQLLDGRAGIELVRHTIAAGRLPESSWDACLLLAG